MKKRANLSKKDGRTMTIAKLPKWTDEIPNKDEMYAAMFIA